MSEIAIVVCPLCGREIEVRNGVAICMHYRPDAKIVIRTADDETIQGDCQAV